MSSRPRRSCARGDTSVLSPSTIFLWSDTRLRQELARRGLSRVGIRQDLIDRLLDAINGVASDESSSCSGTIEENNENIGTNSKRELNVVEESVLSTANQSEGEPTKKKSKRGVATKADSTPHAKHGSSKSCVTHVQELLSKADNEKPVAHTWQQGRPRASAGEDVTFIKEMQATPSTDGDTAGDIIRASESRPSRNLQEPVGPSPTCSIMKPILSILPKVRPIHSSMLVDNVTSGGVQGSATDSSLAAKVSQRLSDSTGSTSIMSNSDIYDSNSGEESPTNGKVQVVIKRTFAESISSTQGTSQSSRKMAPQKVEEERHCSKRLHSGSGAVKPDRLSTLKPITEAWAERLAELKKANPEKFSVGTMLAEKRRVRGIDTHKKLMSSKSPAVGGAPPGASLKKSSVTTDNIADNRLDLLDSIMNQQSEFLQTMRKSDDRNSPVDYPELTAKNEHCDISVGNLSSDRPRDMSSAAEEAYKRYEISYTDSNSDKSSPKSPQILPPPPPPPPPRKLAIQQKCSNKFTCSSGSVDVVQLLVPPPPPPPPQLPPKDIPPPPPPRRPRVTAIEDLPPPPPPPKRLKPARTCSAAKLASEKDSSVVGVIKREMSYPNEKSSIEQREILADVKMCLEHVVFLVSSIKPFDEISGELLPVVEVPVPFSQRCVVRETRYEVLINPTVGVETQENRCDAENNDKPVVSNNEETIEEVDEEYDPLDTSAVEEFEAYVPSAVVSRNVTFDELDSSLLNLPELASSAELEQRSPRSEQYSPASQTAALLEEDVDEGEILEDLDSGSDIQSLSDDSEDDSECEDGDDQEKSLFRKYDSGNFVKIMRRTRKGNRHLDCTKSSHIDEVNPSTETQATCDDSEVEKKPDPKILNDPRHLLQRASAVLQGLGSGQGNQYIQIPYDDDYEEEVCIQPMDSFHGEPVPDDDELFEVAAGLKPKRKEEVVVEERIPELTEKFEIDFYNGDLHLKGSPTDDWVIDPDNQDGLALMWGGVRSTYGIFPSCRRDPNSETDETSLGCVVFQVKIIEMLTTKHLPFDELDPNDVRVGFSFRSSPLVLGEYPGSYCYTSLGKRANNNVFTDYGDSFGIGDVITAHMDFGSGTVGFWKNSESLGPAFTNITVPENEAVYPHICVKNCRVSVNFGTFPGGEKEWTNQPEWVFPNSLPRAQTERAPLPPESKSDCTVLMMVGLPSVGKTTWVRRYIREHPSENWTLISADTILSAMKVNGVSRNSSHIGRWDMVLGLVGKARNRLLSLAARRRRNYILDFTNCDPDTRKKRLALFEGFFRQCVTIVPSDEVMQQRHARHLRQNRGEGTAAVPIETFLELKAVMEMPVVSEFLESVIYVDPAMEDAQIAIDRIAKFNEEGRPWYSSKYSKKRGFWSGSYGDEPFRKSSSTLTRPATATVAEKSHSADTTTVTTVENSSPTTGSRSDSQKAQQQITPLANLSEPPLSVEEVTRPALEGPTTSIVNSEIATGRLPTPVSKPSNPSASNVQHAAASQSVTNCVPPAFSQLPPKVPTIIHPKPFAETAAVPQASPVQVIAPANQPCPFTVQVSTFSPRSKWDTPPPVLPNFSVPPPSLVMPNLYTPNTVPMIPFIPNTSIPPPNIPPPGWPHHLG